MPLVDAFRLVTSLRTQVLPNKHFLFQLAMLEAQQDLGCSVYHRYEWNFYEFNVFRAEGVRERDAWGMYKTIMNLYTPAQVDEDDGNNNDNGDDDCQ